MNILGAGLSGLLAGALDRTATIWEAQGSVPNNHHAILRFRDNKIGRALNIPFKEVRVLKSVICDGQEVPLSPKIANLYSKKVTGSIVSRSVMNLETSTRWIAPANLIPQLAEMCTGRLKLNATIDRQLLADMKRPLISTIPLPSMLGMLGITVPLKFESSPIRVVKYDVVSADVYQTIYFPDPNTPVYRATLTGRELAIEMVAQGSMSLPNYMEVLEAFGLTQIDARMLDNWSQKYGKIVPLGDDIRKGLLYSLSAEHGIFSLGRFACWRNILLDDVYDDFFAIRAMINMGAYDHKKSLAERRTDK